MVCACCSHLCLSPSQGFYAAWGNRSLSSFIFRIFAVWNILDCVGVLHAVVPSCEKTNSAPGPGCHQGKHCETYVIAILMGWCVTLPSNIATLVRFVMWPQKQSNSYLSLLTPYCDIFSYLYWRTTLRGVRSRSCIWRTHCWTSCLCWWNSGVSSTSNWTRTWWKRAWMTYRSTLPLSVRVWKMEKIEAEKGKYPEQSSLRKVISCV